MSMMLPSFYGCGKCPAGGSFQHHTQPLAAHLCVEEAALPTGPELLLACRFVSQGSSWHVGVPTSPEADLPQWGLELMNQ